MPAVDGPVYVPSEWGKKFHSLTTHEALGGGSAGPGKTVVLRWDPLPQIITEHQRCSDPEHPYPLDWGHSKGYALFLRRTSPMLRQTIALAQAEFRQVDPGVRWNENDQEFTFSSGFVYRFGHCKDKGDWSIYHGLELTWLGLDEAAQFIESQYDHLCARVRTDDPVLAEMMRVRLMSNPMAGNEGMEGLSSDGDPNWLRRLFVAPCPEGEKILVREIEMEDGEIVRWTRTYLPARLRDNPNPRFVRDYTALLKTMKPHIRKAYLDGDWYVTVGSFYAEAWSSECIVKPFPIPDDWPVFRSLDWGFKQPGCVHWWAMDPDENVICIKEWTFQGMSASAVALRILEIEEDLGLKEPRAKRSSLTGPADTQLWERREGGGTSKVQDMAAVGVYWEQADKKSRKRNAERVYERLADRRGGIPGLSFFGDGLCEDAVRTLPQIQTDQTDKDCPADGGPDHWHDSTCYACAFASHGRAGLPRRRQREEEDDDDEPAPRRTRGQYGYGGF